MGYLEVCNETADWISLEAPNFAFLDFSPLKSPKQITGNILGPGQRISFQLVTNSLANGSIVHLNLRFNADKVIELRFDQKIADTYVNRKINFKTNYYTNKDEFYKAFGSGTIACYGNFAGYNLEGTVHLNRTLSIVVDEIGEKFPM